MSIKRNGNTDHLWDSFLHGDDSAFVSIYYLFINALLSYGRKLTRDRELLNDSIQEVFLDLYQKRSNSHIPISNSKAYLFVALKNSILKKTLQARKFEDKEVNDSVLGEFSIEYSFQEQLINHEISETKRLHLQQAILALSSGQKEIIYLKFEENLGYKEIAELLNISIESARKQLYRALLSLRGILNRETFYTFISIFIKKKQKKLSMLEPPSDRICKEHLGWTNF